jgi:hypothetical protein
MFYDNERDGDHMQRFKNGVFLKMWVKNETRDAAMPFIGGILLIGAILWGIASLF